jgi:hypothetical protein
MVDIDGVLVVGDGWQCGVRHLVDCQDYRGYQVEAEQVVLVGWTGHWHASGPVWLAAHHQVDRRQLGQQSTGTELWRMWLHGSE